MVNVYESRERECTVRVSTKEKLIGPKKGKKLIKKQNLKKRWKLEAYFSGAIIEAYIFFFWVRGERGIILRSE